MKQSSRFKSNLVLTVLIQVVFAASLSAVASETLCYTERISDAASFNIYTGRNDANNPIVWTHSVPAGILDRVVRVGLYIEAWDVDAPPVDDEHDRVYFNGYDLGLLEGFNDTWITVEKTVPVEAIREGMNELKVYVDELGKSWKVTVRASELRFYCQNAEEDFSIGVNPPSLTVSQGEQGTATVELTALNGFDRDVDLQVEGLPEGVVGVFSPDPVAPSPRAESELRLTVSAWVPAGTYDLIVRGRSGDLEHECSMSLTVEKAAVEPEYEMSIAADPESGRPPLTVRLKAVFGDDKPPEGTIYTWDFGDGGSAFGESATHIFTGPGIYTVELTAGLPGGGRIQTEKRIDVLDFSGRIRLVFSKTEASVGESLKLRITLNNPERQDIAALKLALPLNDALILDGVSSGLFPAVQTPHPVWHIPLLRGGETMEIVLDIHVDPEATPGTIRQTAELNHAGFDEVIVSPEALLEIQAVEIELKKNVDLVEASPGQELLYGITLHNPGFVDLETITISDSLPDQLEFVSARGPLVFNRQGSLLKWTGKIEAGGEYNWQIRTRLKPELFSGDRIQNTAVAESPAMTNAKQSNTVVTVVSGSTVGHGQVQLSHRAEIPQSDIGRVVRLRVTVTNNSASTLIGPELDVLLPSGFDYVEGSSLLDGVAIADPTGRGRIAYSLDRITAGASLMLRYQMVIGASSRRGQNLCRAELRARDSSGAGILRTADARINVSASGLVFMSGLEGQVFLDRDGDGFFSPVDQAVGGVEVVLSSGERSVTDDEGKFSMSQLYPGEYAVGINRAGLDERYRISPPYTRVVALSDGLSDWVELPLVFATQSKEPQSRLEGRVFFDRNGNGRYDENKDTMAAEFTVRLDGSALTRGRNGRFVFTRLKPGAHRLEIEAAGRSGQRDVVLEKGQQTVDFPLNYPAIRVTIQGEKK